ncbi:MAG: PqqD family protein [Rhodothermales bacterium]
MSTQFERYVLNPDVVFTQMEDGEAVLLHLNTREYYSLNETAASIWISIRDGLDRSEIGERLSAQYAAENGDIENALDGYLTELLSNGLITGQE